MGVEAAAVAPEAQFAAAAEAAVVAVAAQVAAERTTVQMLHAHERHTQAIAALSHPQTQLK